MLCAIICFIQELSMVGFQKKICPSCSAINRLNAKKCYNCGHSLNTSSVYFYDIIPVAIIILILIMINFFTIFIFLL